MTANAMKGDQKRCLYAGMDDYLTEPVNPEELRVNLVKWLPADGKKERLATKKWHKILCPIFEYY